MGMAILNLDYEGKKKAHIICPNRKHMDNPTNKLIPKYYTHQHMRDSGWVCTADRKFCPPDEKAVWVCPDCIKEHYEEVKK